MSATPAEVLGIWRAADRGDLQRVVHLVKQVICIFKSYYNTRKYLKLNFMHFFLAYRKLIKSFSDLNAN